MERNPYFWAIDPEGQQLPYLDTVTHRLFETNDVFNMWIVNGEIDFQARHVGIDNFTLYKESEASGDYQVFLGICAGHVCLQLNHTCKDERMREFFQNRNVRIALSLAVNRDELNELIYDGLLTPRQYSPLAMSPNDYPKLANAYIEYDPDRGQRAAGRGRLHRKGRRWLPPVEGWQRRDAQLYHRGHRPGRHHRRDVVQLIAKYLADVGVKATYKYFERSLYTEHFQANEHRGRLVGRRPHRPAAGARCADLPWHHDRPPVGAGLGHLVQQQCHRPRRRRAARGPLDLGHLGHLGPRSTVEPDEDSRTSSLRRSWTSGPRSCPRSASWASRRRRSSSRTGSATIWTGYPIDDTTGDEHLLNTETYFWDDPEEHS